MGMELSDVDSEEYSFVLSKLVFYCGVCVCVRDREREKERESSLLGERLPNIDKSHELVPVPA